MTNRATFNKEDTEHLIALWRDGVPVRDIAIDMGRSFNNVRNKIKQLRAKGLIMTRSTSNKLPDGFVEHTAGAYQLPVDVVKFITAMFTTSADKTIDGVNQCCQAYLDQNGTCYYLGSHVRLTVDDSPSGMVAVLGPSNQLVLACKAIANTRKTMSHTAFINVCKIITENFAHKGVA